MCCERALRIATKISSPHMLQCTVLQEKATAAAVAEASKKKKPANDAPPPPSRISRMNTVSTSYRKEKDAGGSTTASAAAVASTPLAAAAAAMPTNSSPAPASAPAADAPKSPADLKRDAGNAAFKEKLYDRAIELYTEAIALDAHNYNSFCNRGLALKAAGKLEEALADFSMAIQIKPDFGKGAFGRILSSPSVDFCGRECRTSHTFHCRHSVLSFSIPFFFDYILQPFTSAA